MAMKHSVESSSLAEVLDRILEKGIVIDLYIRVSLLGIELLSIDSRIIIAGVETWLVYAAAVGLTEPHHPHPHPPGPPPPPPKPHREE